MKFLSLNRFKQVSFQLKCNFMNHYFNIYFCMYFVHLPRRPAPVSMPLAIVSLNGLVIVPLNAFVLVMFIVLF